MSDDIEQRLKEATEKCLETHAAWNKDQKNSNLRESLMDAVHELRKVAARLEIEIAVSERDEMAAKPIPIPPHRSKRRQTGEDRGQNFQDNGDGAKKPRRSSGKPSRQKDSGDKDAGNKTSKSDNSGTLSVTSSSDSDE